MYYQICITNYVPSIHNCTEDGRLRPKHVAKYNLIAIIASRLDVCCVLTVHNILHNRLMLCNAKVAVCYDVRSKHINAM